MLTSQLDFALPPELIAQSPARPRDSARLLHWRSASTLSVPPAILRHRVIHQLPEILRAGDLLVFNDSRVLRARLHGYKLQSGGAVEAILLREVETNLWEAMLKPSARLRPGTPLRFLPWNEPENVEALWNAEPVERRENAWLLHFSPVARQNSPQSTCNEIAALNVRDALAYLGQVPLPPYIHGESDTPHDADWDANLERDYQTVYARETIETQAALDSAAAPTAGLHFTPELLARLQERGIETEFVTLGVGAGTFRPIKSERVEEHEMHAEEWEISARAAQRINAQKRRGGRVIAVGTTTTRVLESAALQNASHPDCVRSGFGRTDIFIRPGHQFRGIDALLTNFHLPRSTLLALVSAFAQQRATNLDGLQTIRYAYSEAVRCRYRFFSFGDAMFLE